MTTIYRVKLPYQGLKKHYWLYDNGTITDIDGIPFKVNPDTQYAALYNWKTCQTVYVHVPTLMNKAFGVPLPKKETKREINKKKGHS